MSARISQPIGILAFAFALLASGAIFVRSTAFAADCHTAPDSSTPPNSHWYYRTDRTQQHKCWYLRADSEVSEQGDAQGTGEAAPAEPSQSVSLAGLSRASAPQPQAPTKDLVTIVTGNKFQQILPENSTGKDRRALLIENKNTNGDSCWVFVGTGKASKEESDQVVASGGEYVKYWPFVPSDAIQVTCASSSDALSVEYQ